MKLAFVFPGQGSQSVGMMEGFDDHPAVRATFDEASSALGRGPVDAGDRGPGRGPRPHGQHAAGDAHRRCRGVACLARRRRLGAGRRRRPQPRRIHGAGRRRARSPSTTPCRWCAFARRRCRRPCPPVSGRWRRSWVPTTTRSRPPAAKSAQARSGRAGQLQRARADRDRRAAARPSSARWRPRRRAVRGARCCCPSRRRSTARCSSPRQNGSRSDSRGSRSRRRRFPSSTTSTSRPTSRPRRSGARSRGRRRVPCAGRRPSRRSPRRRHARRRVRARQGARRTWSSASTSDLEGIALSERIDARRTRWRNLPAATA